jgi:hypothetical protein
VRERSVYKIPGRRRHLVYVYVSSSFFFPNSQTIGRPRSKLADQQTTTTSPRHYLRKKKKSSKKSNMKLAIFLSALFAVGTFAIPKGRHHNSPTPKGRHHNPPTYSKNLRALLHPRFALPPTNPPPEPSIASVTNMFSLPP